MSVINTKFAGPSLHTGHQERAGFTVSIGILKRRTKRMREHHKRETRFSILPTMISGKSRFTVSKQFVFQFG